MSADRVAVRYAKAFVEALGEGNALAQVEDFNKFCAMVAANAQLSGLFANVTVSAADKKAVVTALAAEASLPDLVKRFLTVVADNGRLGILAQIRAAVAHRLDQVRDVRAVTLTTATPPSEREVVLFNQSMEKLLGGGVRVRSQVDVALLGGAIAQVGSFVYDGSVRGQLNRLRAELVKEK